MIDRLKRTGRSVAVGFAVAAAFMLIAGSAAAQTYTPTPVQNVLELNTNTPGPGGTFTGRGCGFQPGTTVSATIAGSPAGTLTVGADGCAVGTMTAPNQPGTYTVCYTGLTPNAGTQQLCNTITVSSGQAATTTVPFTGSGKLVYVAIGGALLLLIGSAFVLTFRRRRIQA